MAIYYLDITIHGRQPRAEKVPHARQGRAGGKPRPSRPRSAVAAAAYRSGERLRDDNREQDIDYSDGAGRVAHSEILLPNDAPEEFRDRATLWNAVEEAEKRRDAQLSREVKIALPAELSLEQNRELVREFSQGFVDRGMCADIAIHVPEEGKDERNVHAHINMTMREVGPDGFGKKVREWNDRSLVNETRERWAELANQHLERAGIEARIDHRTYAEQLKEAVQNRDLEGIAAAAKVPGIHKGPVAHNVPIDGRESSRAKAVRHENYSPQRMKQRDEMQKIQEYAEVRAKEIKALSKERDTGEHPPLTPIDRGRDREQIPAGMIEVERSYREKRDALNEEIADQLMHELVFDKRPGEQNQIERNQPEQERPEPVKEPVKEPEKRQPEPAKDRPDPLVEKAKENWQEALRAKTKIDMEIRDQNDKNREQIMADRAAAARPVEKRQEAERRSIQNWEKIAKEAQAAVNSRNPVNWLNREKHQEELKTALDEIEKHKSLEAHAKHQVNEIKSGNGKSVEVEAAEKTARERPELFQRLEQVKEVQKEQQRAAQERAKERGGRDDGGR